MRDDGINLKHQSCANGMGRHLADNALVALLSPQITRRHPTRHRTHSDDPSYQLPRDLGLTRSKTVAEFRSTSRINLTGVIGERQQNQSRTGLSRSSTWCASPSTSRSTSTSTTSLPVIPSAEGRKEALISASCDGLVARVSALRSLANNPNFKVSIVNGLPRVTPRHGTSKPETDNPSQKKGNTQSNGEVVIQCSRHGYHSRSNSPTYRRLIQSKEYLEMELCKELREIRRRLEGQKARENSAIDGGLRFSMDDHESDEWYVKMVGKEMDNEQRDETITDNMEMSDERQPVSGLETLDLASPAPRIHLKFESRCIQTHITDSDILAIDVEEEERKARERREKEKKRKSVRDRSHSPTYRRSCEVCYMEKPRTEYLRTKKSRRVKFRSYKIDTDSSDSNSDDHFPLSLHESSLKPDFLPPANPLIQVNIKSRGKFSAKSKSSKSTVSSEPTRLVEDSSTGQEEPDTGGAVHVNIEQSVVLPSLMADQPPSRPTSIADHSRTYFDITDEPEIKIKSPSPPPPPSSPPPPDPPKLTEKEKFLMMRKRMEDRKKEREKKKESFEDYSMLAFAKNRGAGNRDSGLGNALSNRLEKMASFKLNKSGGERTRLTDLFSDDEDDDDEDDDEDDE